MRIYYIIRFVIFTILAVLIGIFSHQLLEYLDYLVGGVMLIFGLGGLFFPIYRSKKKFFEEYQFYLGCIEILLGIIIMTAFKDANGFNSVCMIWGTWTIVRESFELYETSHKFMHKFPAILSLALSIVEIVFSILLIVSAEEAIEHHALTHIYLLVPEFIIYALSPLLFDIYSHKNKKE